MASASQQNVPPPPPPPEEGTPGSASNSQTAVGSQEPQPSQAAVVPPATASAAQTVGIMSAPGGNMALILLAAATGVDLLSDILILVAYIQATWYGSVCLKQFKDRPNCEAETFGSFAHCETFKGESYLRHTSTSTPTCPSKWMVEPFMYIEGFCCVASVVLLIALIVQRGKSERLLRWGAIATIIVGAIVLICALSYLGFYVWMRVSEYYCSDNSYNRVPNILRRRGAKEVVYADHGSGEQQPTSKARTCDAWNDVVFQPWFIISGALLAGVAGILHLVAGCLMVGTKKRVGGMQQQAGPQMSMMTQQQPMMTQQMYGQQTMMYGQQPMMYGQPSQMTSYVPPQPMTMQQMGMGYGAYPQYQQYRQY